MALRFGSIFVTPSLRPPPLPVQLKHFRFVTVAFRLSTAPDNLHFEEADARIWTALHFVLGCSYHLHSNHRFLSTWSVVMLEAKQHKKEEFSRVLSCRVAVSSE